MPKRSATKGFPCKPEDCYASRHLDGPDYKVWDQMKAAAKLKDDKRIFYAPVRPYLVNAVNQSPSAVDATLDRLEASGWIINLGRTRKADGTETPNRYEVLEHPAWSALHPGECPDYKLAPNWETAQLFGVKKGDRLRSGLVPTNFRDLDTALGRALLKLDSVAAVRIAGAK